MKLLPLVASTDFIFGTFVLVIILIFVFLLLTLLSETVQSFIEVLVGKPLFVHFVIFPRKLEPRDEILLNKHFLFYRNLKGRKKIVFASRVARFQRDKLFKIDKEITDKELVKLLISATAIRVTFGLRNYLFPSFHTIVVHAKSYYSRYSKSVNLGETNRAGFIIFSWKAFVFGLSDNNDSLNLGYHEFAHALFVEHMKISMEPVFSNYFEKWERLIKNQNKIQEVKDNKIFREYATQNMQEFFAVSVENFFEKPIDFKSELPQLYEIMSKMLNQNPLQATKPYYENRN